jgi:hypothetical protein
MPPLTGTAVKVCGVPPQTPLVSTEIDTLAGNAGLTVIVTGSESVDKQPFFSCCTVYVPDADTVIDCVVSPVDHR